MVRSRPFLIRTLDRSPAADPFFATSGCRQPPNRDEDDGRHCGPGGSDPVHPDHPARHGRESSDVVSIPRSCGDGPLTPFLFPLAESVELWRRSQDCQACGPVSRFRYEICVSAGSVGTRKRAYESYACRRARSRSLKKLVGRPCFSLPTVSILCPLFFLLSHLYPPLSAWPLRICLPSFPVSMFLCIYCAGFPSFFHEIFTCICFCSVYSRRASGVV